MSVKVVPVILAGGVGKRLWPVSRKSCPKQFCDLSGDKKIGRHRTLFQSTLKRVSLLDSTSNLDITSPIVVTGENYLHFVRSDLDELVIDDATIILEPCSRNTAPAIAVAALEAEDKYKSDFVLLVLPSDHLIRNLFRFRLAVDSAVNEAMADRLVVFGCESNESDRSYGYISPRGKTPRGEAEFVGCFVEKPQVVPSSWLVNCGIFVMKGSLYLDELKKYYLNIYDTSVSALRDGVRGDDTVILSSSVYSRCRSISIDYAIMERTLLASVVRLDAGWSDLGSWRAIADDGIQDDKNNVISGDVVVQDSQRCYVTGSDRLIAIVGIDDVIVVDTPDALLVMDRLSDPSSISNLVKSLEVDNRPEVESDYV